MLCYLLKIKKYFIFAVLLSSFLFPTSVFPCSKVFSNNTSYLTKTEAQQLLKELTIRTLSELKKQKKIDSRLERVPLNLDVIYKDQGWTNFPEFFGTTREWYTYRKLKAYFEELDLQNTINENLAIRYWINIDHLFQYLVNGKGVEWKHFIYEDAQAIVQRLNIRTIVDLRNKRKEVKLKIKEKNKLSGDEINLLYYVPADPKGFYKEQGWVSRDFFAKETWLPVHEAQALVQELGIKSVFEMWNRRKTDIRLQDIPSHPGQIYKSGWTDYLTFFGLKKVSINREQQIKVIEENEIFLKYVYFMIKFPGVFGSYREVQQKVLKKHLEKLFIESTF